MKYTIRPTNSEETAPVTQPSTVLLGLTSGATLCLPNHLPPNIAKLSHTHVERHAKMSVNAHMRLTLITIIAPNRTQG